MSRPTAKTVRPAPTPNLADGLHIPPISGGANQVRRIWRTNSVEFQSDELAGRPTDGQRHAQSFPDVTIHLQKGRNRSVCNSYIRSKTHKFQQVKRLKFPMLRNVIVGKHAIYTDLHSHHPVTLRHSQPHSVCDYWGRQSGTDTKPGVEPPIETSGSIRSLRFAALAIFPGIRTILSKGKIAVRRNPLLMCSAQTNIKASRLVGSPESNCL